MSRRRQLTVQISKPTALLHSVLVLLPEEMSARDVSQVMLEDGTVLTVMVEQRLVEMDS